MKPSCPLKALWLKELKEKRLPSSSDKWEFVMITWTGMKKAPVEFTLYL